MAKFNLDTPFKEAWPASNGNSDYEGEDLLPFDVATGVKAHRGFVTIGEAPEDQADYMKELDGKA